jgi:hypothetical protein
MLAWLVKQCKEQPTKGWGALSTCKGTASSRSTSLSWNKDAQKDENIVHGMTNVTRCAKQPKCPPAHGWNLAQVHKWLSWSVYLIVCRMMSLAVIRRAIIATTQENVIIEASASKIDDMQ